MECKLLLILALVPLLSHATETKKEFLTRLIQGHYDLKGKEVDSKQKYLGTAHIKQEGDKFLIKKMIHGKTISSLGRIEPLAADNKTLVLRFTIDDGNNQYLQTCNISQLLNQSFNLIDAASLDCGLVLVADKTRLYGIEAFEPKVLD